MVFTRWTMKKVRFTTFIILMAVIISLLSVSGLVLAQDGETPATDNATQPPPEPELISEPVEEPEEEEEPDTIVLTTEFPKLDAIATGSFDFAVEMEYKGNADRVFDLNTIVPAGWDAYVTPQYDSKRISSISIDQSYLGTTKTVKVSAQGPIYPVAEPGEYKIVLEAISDDVVGKIDLTAKVTAKYDMMAVPANERYNTDASAGKDNIFTIGVVNTGTAVIDNVTFTASKPDGWEIEFEPEKIDLFEINDPKEIDVNIKPPPKTVAGDYMITLRVSGKQFTADKMDIRVTVKTPAIWGWVGVGIIAVVVIGLIFIFMRFGRR
jgi:uncharacterized membrane protein